MPKVNSESFEQRAFVQWWRIWSRGKLGVMFSIPNERKSNAQHVANLKAMGMLPGTPDLFICWPRLGFNGLFIEMKSKTGRPTLKQKEVHEAIRKSGYAVVVCKGCEEAIKAVTAYGIGNGDAFYALHGEVK